MQELWLINQPIQPLTYPPVESGGVFHSRLRETNGFFTSPDAEVSLTSHETIAIWTIPMCLKTFFTCPQIHQCETTLKMIQHQEVLDAC